MHLKVITMVDQNTNRMTHLRESCDRNDLDLEVLQMNHWINNAFKLRLMNNYLSNPSLSPEDLVMVVDAYDVIILQPADRLISRFEEFKTDILFSAETNYYFREPDLALLYWMYYPRDPQSVFHFLNSGSFIGTVSALKRLYRQIESYYLIDYTNDFQLKTIRSDQYVYSRFYVDYMTGAVSTDFTFKIDSNQELFGCTGGRMAVVNWPAIHWIQDYLFFKYERRWLKTFWMKGGQTSSRDFTFDKKSFVYRNTKTGTCPPVLHLPGTHRSFEKALKRISGKAIIDKWLLLFPITLLISAIAYVRSMTNFLYIRIRNGGKVDFESIFPNRFDQPIFNRSNPVAVGKYNLSIMENQSLRLLSILRTKEVFILVDKPNSFTTLQKLGIEIDPDHVLLASQLGELESIMKPGAMVLDLLNEAAVNEEILSRYTVLVATGDLKRILLGNRVKRAFPSDNPFTILR